MLRKGPLFALLILFVVPSLGHYQGIRLGKCSADFSRSDELIMFYFKGLLVDYESSVTRGVTNETLESLVNYMQESLSSNVSVQTTIISNFDQFASEIEEDPRLCKSICANCS